MIQCHHKSQQEYHQFISLLLQISSTVYEQTKMYFFVSAAFLVIKNSIQFRIFPCLVFKMILKNGIDKYQ